MLNFHDSFETPKRSYISVFKIYMNVPLNVYRKEVSDKNKI